MKEEGTAWTVLHNENEERVGSGEHVGGIYCTALFHSQRVVVKEVDRGGEEGRGCCARHIGHSQWMVHV